MLGKDPLLKFVSEEVLPVTKYRPGLAVYPQVSQALQQATADIVSGKSVEEAAKTYQAAVEKAVGGKVQVIVDCISTETTLKAIGPALADDGFFAILLPIKGGDKVRPEGAKEEVKFYCEWEFSSDFS